jgi:plasmid stabilization system protein ParE
VFNDLLTDPKKGALVKQRDDYRSYVARFKPRRGAHGHRVLYRETDYGILVIRILHTAMNWTDYL